MRVAIVGAGPAGSHLAHELSRRGAEVRLFDAREAWEKPCGGGVTSKALREFDYLNSGPKQMISSLRLISAGERELTLTPSHDFAVYSRKELARMMRDRAVEAGAALHCTRVEKTEFSNGRWRIETPGGAFGADFLVGADGASSVIRRRVGVSFGENDYAYALGWHVKSADPPARVDVKYLDDVSGYLWLFPRRDHISFGIASGYRETTPARLKEMLIAFIETRDRQLAVELRSPGGSPRATFYAAMIPSLDVTTLDRLRACDAGKGWALVGDAAGFVDPLTGEGIYYAIKSADLLARALSDRIESYDDRWRAEFGAELRRASQLQSRFYYGNFAGARLTDRMIQFAKYHPGIRSVLRDLIAGDQGYVGLKRRLVRSLLPGAPPGSAGILPA
ncbi:MAG: NAD(P)/FAD-dependent oxidoreductase [Acidobacteriota bacterium]|nr:MAG: NAD(P)/FAD-dependent oxidoreductase [Acidobacteriota bacterium]